MTDPHPMERSTLVGLIGAGPMARAVARGWREPVLCTDAGSGRAAQLAGEVGGNAEPDNATLAGRAAFVVLCHQPARLEAVAADIDGVARAVVSILSGVTLDRLRAAYPRTPVLRFALNLPVEVRAGTVCYVGARGADDELEGEVVGRFSRLGLLLRLDERLVPVAIGLSGVGPAYLALIAEAEVEAAVRHGLPADQAGELVAQTMAGTAALLRRRDLDTGGLGRSVASPGGPTEAGLAVLERAGVREMFRDAMAAVVDTIELGRTPPEPGPGAPVGSRADGGSA